jgi:hypothetical protein
MTLFRPSFVIAPPAVVLLCIEIAIGAARFHAQPADVDLDRY